MSETDQTKVCPQCAETIKVAAKVCPYCRYWQKRWSLQNPQVGMALCIAVSLAVLSCCGIFFDRMFGSKEQFATYRDKISVVASQFSHRVNQSNLMNTVVGTLTNRSSITWKEVGVEAQFLDKSGKEIDAITVKADDYRNVVILSHAEVAFKIEGIAARPESDYDTYKVTVRWAKDSDAWP